MVLDKIDDFCSAQYALRNPPQSLILIKLLSIKHVARLQSAIECSDDYWLAA